MNKLRSQLLETLQDQQELVDRLLVELDANERQNQVLEDQLTKAKHKKRAIIQLLACMEGEQCPDPPGPMGNGSPCHGV